MATYTKVSRSIPSQQRAALITAVAVGDKIDLEDVLGRPARKVIFLMTDAADVIGYKMNHLRKIRAPRTAEESYSVADQVYGVFETTVTNFWASDADTFTGTGSTQLEIASNLSVSAIEIISLSLSTGATISIEVT